MSKLIPLGTDLATQHPFTLTALGAATKTLGIFGKKGSGGSRGEHRERDEAGKFWNAKEREKGEKE